MICDNCGRNLMSLDVRINQCFRCTARLPVDRDTIDRYHYDAGYHATVHLVGALLTMPLLAKMREATECPPTTFPRPSKART